MIRSTLIYGAFGLLMVLAVKRWYLALSGLVVLTVLSQHPAMPHELLGVQGLNPWNAAFLVIAVSWFVHRRAESERRWDKPSRLLVFWFIAELLLVVIAGVVATLDARSVKGPYYAAKLDTKGMLVESVINPLKYLTMGALFYAGTVNRERARMALLAAVGSGICYAALLLKAIKLRIFTIDFNDARRLTDKMIGLFANDLAQILAFTIFAAVILCPLLAKRWQRFFWLLATALTVPCFIAMKSRSGYLAFCVTGVVLGVLRWRRILLLLPVAAALVIWLEPSVAERVLTGVRSSEPYAGQDPDWDEISAGRVTNIWPPTWKEILRSPWLGHGRYGILRARCYEEIEDLEGEVPSHPHNAYLEVLLDAGVVGLLICCSFLAGIVWVSIALMREKDDRFISTVGTVSLIAATVVLTASLSGYSFFPYETTVPYLALWGVALRLREDRRAGAAGDVSLASLEGPGLPSPLQSSPALPASGDPTREDAAPWPR